MSEEVQNTETRNAGAGGGENRGEGRSENRGENRGGGDRGGDRGGRPGGDRGGRGGGGKPRRRFYYRRRKFCKFQADKIDFIDYKDVELLQQFIPELGKIAPRRQTGTSARFQRQLATAIKRARYMALLPYRRD